MNFNDFRAFHKAERRQTMNLPPVLGIMPSVTTADVIDMIEPTSHTYRLDYRQNTGETHADRKTSRIQRNIDGLAAMEQFCYKVIYTERYQYLIYSWNYGIELADLFGQQQTFVRAELPRRIREALLTDHRVTSVTGFDFSGRMPEQFADKQTTRQDNKNLVDIGFTVQTIYGDITINRTVTTGG